MAWIRSHDELPTHPKTRKVARRLGVNIPTVIGHLHVLWYWCLTHRPDGRLENMDADDIADAAGWDGDGEPFVASLKAAGWLDDDGGTLVVHDWWDGAGKTIKSRRFATERQRRARDTKPNDDESRVSHADVTRDSRVSHGAERERESEREKDLTPLAPPAPPAGDGRARKRATKLPDGWEPRPETVTDLAGKFPRIDQRQEVDKFRDHARSKGRTLVDWEAGYRNWIRQADTYRQERAGDDQPAKPPGPKVFVPPDGRLPDKDPTRSTRR
jgi:hypothetical protein